MTSEQARAAELEAERTYEEHRKTCPVCNAFIVPGRSSPGLCYVASKLRQEANDRRKAIIEEFFSASVPAIYEARTMLGLALYPGHKGDAPAGTDNTLWAFAKEAARRLQEAEFLVGEFRRALLDKTGAPWRLQAEILRDWLPERPDKDDRPLRFVVRWRNLYLRHSRGVSGQPFWDVYPDECVSQAWATIVLSRAEVPPILAGYPGSLAMRAIEADSTQLDAARVLAQHVVDTSNCTYTSAGGKEGDCKGYGDGPCCYCRAKAFLSPPEPR